MSPRYSDNGNRHVSSSDGQRSLAAQYKTELIITAVLIVYFIVVSSVLGALGILDCGGSGSGCAGKQKPVEETGSAPLSVVSSATDTPAPAAVAEPHDMGAVTLLVAHKLGLTPGETCTSFVSSNEAVATVDSSGTVMPVAFGEADVTGTAASGSTYTWHVSVRKVAYLVFSDFPNDCTLSILDTLKSQEVKASFFVCLRSKSDYFPIYRRIIDDGHTLGNHTSSHDPEIFASSDELKTSISKLENYLVGNFSYTTKYVSIPDGTGQQGDTSVRAKVAQSLHDSGYSLVDCTFEVGDYTEISKSDIMTNIRDKAKNDREVISMHFYDKTAAILPDIINYLRSVGYEFERFDDSPQVYSSYYGWEQNVNQLGAGLWTDTMISGQKYSQS